MSAFEPPTPQEATLEDDEYDVKARSDDEPARDAPRVRRFARLMGRRALDDAERERRANLTAGVPYLSLVRSPREHGPVRESAPRTIRVATYNVHRWTGINGRRSPDGARAGFVISELAADVMALQEVLRPFEGDDPLPGIADALRLHLAFVTTRVHRRGELGNAILSRWPITSVFALDLSFSRLERRSAVAVQFLFGERPLTVVATHLALGDRTRHRQVRSILEHERLQGPVVLLGDLNAWRPSKATRDLEEHWGAQHQEIDWPASFPAARPILALDRIYARGARIESVAAHSSAAARKASDHLPIVAKLHLE